MTDTPLTSTPHLSELEWAQRELALWREHYHRVREQLELWKPETIIAERPSIVRCRDCVAWDRQRQRDTVAPCARRAGEQVYRAETDGCTEGIPR